MKKIIKIFKCIVLIITLNLLFSCMYLKIQMIEIESFPNKLDYYVGESLDVEGATIKVTYENNTTEIIDITKEMIRDFDSSVENLNLELKVYYKGFETSFIVRVFDEEVGFDS